MINKPDYAYVVAQGDLNGYIWAIRGGDGKIRLPGGLLDSKENPQLSLTKKAFESGLFCGKSMGKLPIYETEADGIVSHWYLFTGVHRIESYKNKKNGEFPLTLSLSMFLSLCENKDNVFLRKYFMTI